MADAVYIVPNPSHRDLLNQVEVRPLDYDYLTMLAPGPQRFYELLSFQVYGALAGGRPRAKMLYSEYCNYAPQNRYPEFEKVKKQMFKIHGPHRDSGYILKVEYEQLIDAQGERDWEMLYTPGPKAVAEFEAFTRRQTRLPAVTEVAAPSLTSSEQMVTDADGANPALLAELTRRGIAKKKARELIENLKPGQEAIDQLEYVDVLVSRDTRHKLDNPPGLYVFYVRDNILPPADFPSSRKRRLMEQSRKVREEQQAITARLKLDYDAYCAAEVERYVRDLMPQHEYKALLAQHRRSNRNLFRDMPEPELAALTEGTVKAEIRQSGRVELMTLQEFATFSPQ